MNQTAVGHFTTTQASQYLQQLCKHFGHRVEAIWDETTGLVPLSAVIAHLAASEEALTVTLEGDSADALARGQEVIDSHLARFAFREGFEHMAWDQGVPLPAG